MADEIAGWHTRIIQRDTPKRLVLALSWLPLPQQGEPPRHTRVQQRLLRGLAEQSRRGIRVNRTVPVLLQVDDLKRLCTPHAAPPLPELIAEQLGPAGEVDSLARLVATHLQLGKVLLVLDGLADVDRAGQFLTRAEATMVLDGLARARAKRVLLVARGSGVASALPVVARQAQLVAAGFCTDWLVTPHADDPAHPLHGHIAWTLGDPDGPAARQILSIGLAAADHMPADRLQTAMSFLVPDGDLEFERSGSAPPRIARELIQRDLLLSVELERWTEADLGRRLTGSGPSHPGVVIVDAGQGRGGWGKTTVLLSLIARARLDHRFAIYLSLANLPAWSSVRQEDTILDIALRSLPVQTSSLENDRALTALLESTGVVLVLDGLNEVPVEDRPRFAGIVVKLAEALKGGVPGLRVVVASRSEDWSLSVDDIASTPKADAVPPARVELLPAPQQLLRLLPVVGPAGAPVALQIGHLDEAQAISYLRRANPDIGDEVLAALGPARESVLTHPGLLGLLTRLNRTALERHADEQSEPHLYPWQIADLIVADRLMRRLTSSQFAWLREQVLAFSPEPAATAGYCVQELAFRMAIGPDGSDSVSLGEGAAFVRDVIRQDAAARLEREVQQELELLLDGTESLNASNRDIIRRNVRQRKEESFGSVLDASDSDLLDSLCDASQVLLRDGGSYRMVHSLVGDLLASTAVIRRLADDAEWTVADFRRLHGSGVNRFVDFRRWLGGDKACLPHPSIVGYLSTTDLDRLIVSLSRELVASQDDLWDAAVRTLAARDLDRLCEHLTTLFDDTQLRVRQAGMQAAEAVAPLLAERNLPWLRHLVSTLLRDADRSMVLGALRVLAAAVPALDGHDATWLKETLAPALSDVENSQVCEAALRTMATAMPLFRRDDVAWLVARMEPSLAHPVPELRQAALQALDAATPLLPANRAQWHRSRLEERLADDNLTVYRAAMRLLRDNAAALLDTHPRWMRTTLDRELVARETGEDSLERRLAAIETLGAIAPLMLERYRRPTWLLRHLESGVTDQEGEVRYDTLLALKPVLPGLARRYPRWFNAWIAPLDADPDPILRQLAKEVLPHPLTSSARSS